MNDPIAAPARDRLHRLDPEPGLRPRRHGRRLRRRAGDRARRRAARRLRGPRGRSCQLELPDARRCTRSPRWRRPRWPSGSPKCRTDRASSPSTSPRLILGDGPSRAQHHRHRLPPGAQLDRPDLALLPARPAGLPQRLGDVAIDGILLSLALIFVARPVAALLATAFSPFDHARAGDARAGPGCGARCRSGSRPSR